MDATKLTAIQPHEKVSRALPYVSIIASCLSIILIGVSLYSMTRQMKHTEMQIQKMEDEIEGKKTE